MRIILMLAVLLVVAVSLVLPASALAAGDLELRVTENLPGGASSVTPTFAPVRPSTVSAPSQNPTGFDAIGGHPRGVR